MDKTVYLLRHCQAAGPESAAELTHKGKEQAIELIHFFEKLKVEHIVSSPFTRAIQSIEPTANRLGLQIKTDSRLGEHRLISENIQDWLKRLKESFQNMDLEMTDEESISEVTNKGMEVLEAAPDSTFLSIHGNIMGLLLKQINGVQGIKEWIELSHPDVYVVKREKGHYYARRIWNRHI